jgi:hypothetical protein
MFQLGSGRLDCNWTLLVTSVFITQDSISQNRGPAGRAGKWCLINNVPFFLLTKKNSTYGLV